MSIKDNKMSCVKVKVNLLDGQRGNLDPREQFLFDEHLRHCANCAHELLVISEMREWLQNDPTPQPSDAMAARFLESLARSEKAVKQEKRNWHYWLERLRGRLGLRFGVQVAFTGLVLLIGVFAGYEWRGKDRQRFPSEELSTKPGEVQAEVVMTGLRNSSAPERLEAVSLSGDLPQINDKVVDALLATLNRDADVNVRLAALDALSQLADMPHVREGLIRSLGYQEFPLVQLALADVMLRLNEKRSLEPLRALLMQRNLEQIVRSKVEECIKELS